MSALPVPRTRAELISLLTEACELEHGLACSYLYTAFSLKQHRSEGGLTFEQARKAKFWASQIFFVASQEMLHLAQAWNLLTAIGGTPYCLRPNLPQNSRYYPLRARIALEPFGERSLKRFVVYETPAQATSPWARRQASLSLAERARGHVTIGELYDAIAAGFRTIPNLFDGVRADQVGQSSAQFYELARVVDLASAETAIRTIVEQGEGAVLDRVDCHYGVFMAILADFRNERRTSGSEFQPVRPMMSNPVADTVHGYGAHAHPVKDPATRSVAELFDRVYFVMLQALAFGFAPSVDPLRAGRSVSAAIELMTTAVRPLGDALATLPSGVKGLTAGPAFGLTRFIALPSHPGLAVALITERLGQLAEDAAALAAGSPAAHQIAVSASRMRDVAARLNSGPGPAAIPSALRTRETTP